MPRDYAKYKPQVQQVAQGWHKRLLLVAVLICIAIILVFGVYFYKQNGAGSLRLKISTWITKAHVFINHKQANTPPPLKPAAQKTKQEAEIRFNFYNELPNMQVTLPETEEAAPAAKETKKEESRPEKANQYIVQLGIFKNETAAGQLRVSLLLAGFEADTVTSPDENNTVVYRVQKGPYATLAQADRKSVV